MHDIDIKPITGQRAGGLVMEATAATYRYLEEGGALVDDRSAGGKK
jgi:Tfp pilus assembly protein PilO